MVRPSMALRRRLVFCATCGVNPRCAGSATKSFVSYALSAATVRRRFRAGSRPSIVRAASRSA